MTRLRSLLLPLLLAAAAGAMAIRGGIAAAAVLAFITSFNQVPVSLFLTGPGVSTLPIEMLAHLETSYDPSIAALSTLMVVFTIAVVAITERVLGLSKHL